MIKTRYQFIKRLYPNYVLIFLQKKELITFGIDYKIEKIVRRPKEKLVKSLECGCINYLLIDNMNIIKKQEFLENQYTLFAKKIELLDICLTILHCHYQIKE